MSWSKRTHSGAIVVSVLLAVYAASAPRTLPEADSGELAANAVCGGIPHPPGYPLLVLGLQLFARLSPVLGLTPALSAFSILCTALAAWICMRVLAERGYTPAIAGTATVAVFLSSHVWRAATSFEPFALNLLLAAGVLWSCEQLPRRPEQQTAWSVALGACFGLGLCNHHSLVTLAPLAWCALWPSPQRALWFMVGVALGATPLCAFLYLRTQPGFVWGDWQEFGQRLIVHVLRREYGSFTLAASEATGAWYYGPVRFLSTLPSALSYIFLVPLAIGLARTKHTRRLDLGLALSLVASAILFPLLFQLRGTPLDNLIAERFFALPTFLLLLPVTEGLRVLGRSRAQLALALAALALHAALVWPQAERVTRRFYEDHIRNIFDLLPPNATLVVVADGGFSGGLFGRCVLQRSDVQLIMSSLDHDWYIERLAAARRSASVQQRQAPLYLLDIPTLQRARPPQAYAVGPLLRVVTPDIGMPSAHNVFEQNRALFQRLRLPTRETVKELDAWEAEELTNYWRSWDLIGKRLADEGDSALAATAYQYRDLFER